MAIGLLVGVAGCEPADGTATDSATRAVASAADLKLLHAVVDQVNATADRPPADQRAVLQRVVDPARAADQRECSPARTTVSFDPAWSDLRPDPNGRNTGYVLPTLIRIHTGGRITGTDTAALIVTISAGTAHLPPLCVA